MEVGGGHFSPQFINSNVELVVLEPINQEQIRGIAQIQMALLRKRLQERDLGLEIDDEAMDKLVAVGFDPVYGARPLKRAIQQYIENPLAQEVLAGTFAPGTTIHCGIDDKTGNMKFTT